jgi:hypothetical protein
MLLKEFGKSKVYFPTFSIIDGSSGKQYDNSIMKIIVILLAFFFVAGCQKKYVNPEICMVEPNSGPCEAYIIKYYFDKEEKKCKEFVYGGCEGVVPFDTLDECKQCECNSLDYPQT